jgi:DNA-binding XRE family transcriptional regulator
MTITSAQVKAARELLGWTRWHLAKQAGVSLTTIRDFELGLRIVGESLIAAVQRALEDAAGVEFTNGGEPGVKMRRVIDTIGVVKSFRAAVDKAYAKADKATRAKVDEIRSRFRDTSADPADRAADSLNSLRGQVHVLVEGGAKRDDFPEIG